MDTEHRIHESRDLAQLPADQRQRARRCADAAVTPSASMPRAPSGCEQPFPAERAGGPIRVRARVNARVSVSFIIDPAAPGSSLPYSAARELGLAPDERLRTAPVGFPGPVPYAGEIDLMHLDLGLVVAENLKLNVVDGIADGVLGANLARHFEVVRDPASGTVYLKELTGYRLDGVIGRNDKATWVKEITRRRAAYRSACKRLTLLPAGPSPQRERLEAERDYWENQLNELHLRGTRSGVPFEWIGSNR